MNIEASEEDVTNCAKSDQQGCDGGHSRYSWTYFYETGVFNRSCQQYTGQDGHCSSSCDINGGPNLKFKAYTKGSFMCYSDCSDVIDDILQEVYENGPTSAHFDVYEDFYDYSGGIYLRNSDKMSGGHVITIIGWGYATHPDSGEQELYWECANSWGPDWGADGFFLIWDGTARMPYQARGGQLPYLSDMIIFDKASVSANSASYYTAAGTLGDLPEGYGLQSIAPTGSTDGSLFMTISGGPFLVDAPTVVLTPVLENGDELTDSASDVVVHSSNGTVLELNITSELLYRDVLLIDGENGTDDIWYLFKLTITNDDEDENALELSFRLIGGEYPNIMSALDSAATTTQIVSLFLVVILLVAFVVAVILVPSFISERSPKMLVVLRVLGAWIYDTWFFCMFVCAVALPFSEDAFALFAKAIETVAKFVCFGVNPQIIDGAVSSISVLVALVLACFQLSAALATGAAAIASHKRATVDKLVGTCATLAYISLFPSLIVASQAATTGSTMGCASLGISLLAVFTLFCLGATSRFAPVGPFALRLALTPSGFSARSTSPAPSKSSAYVAPVPLPGLVGPLAAVVSCVALTLNAVSPYLVVAVVLFLLGGVGALALLLPSAKAVFLTQPHSSVFRAAQFLSTFVLVGALFAIVLVKASTSDVVSFNNSFFFSICAVVAGLALLANILTAAATVSSMRFAGRLPLNAGAGKGVTTVDAHEVEYSHDVVIGASLPAPGTPMPSYLRMSAGPFAHHGNGVPPPPPPPAAY